MTGGRVMMTAGVDALPSDVKAVVIRKVATFTEFTPDNDPHGEHDFDNLTLAGRKFSGVVVNVKFENWPAARPVLAMLASRRSPEFGR